MAKIAIAALIAFLAIPVQNQIEIKVALYDSISPSVNLLEECLHYGWVAGGKKYVINVSRIGYDDVVGGNLSKYDVLLIGASGRQYFHALNPKWKEKVRKFVRNGGGYVGICGGANIASRGYEKPRHPLDFIINNATLCLIDAYINDNQYEEWQYLWKEGIGKEGGLSNIPVKHELYGEIFNEKCRYITYGGGPGLYGMKVAKPIAKFMEEPSDVAPLHYWIWLGKWIPWKKITTDIKEQYAACVSEYGNGKVIVFSSHPEIPPKFNGSIKEYFGFSIYGVPRYVYAWVGGNKSNISYNWWIVRRSIAYVLSIPLPPPQGLMTRVAYENGYISAYAEYAEVIEFYVDGKFIGAKNEPPYKIEFNGNGKKIMAVAYSKNAFAWDEIKI